MVCLWSFVCICGNAFGQERSLQNTAPRIVVLDPGHGGNDSGAAGTDNLQEKQVAMTFSRILAERLKSRYRVLLTRTDDYDIPMEDRVAGANHAQADLFLSIHTGGSRLRQVDGMSIFYSDREAVKKSAPEAALSGSGMSGQLKPWDAIDPLNVEKSRYLADLLKLRLTEGRGDLKIAIMGAPLMIAVGADMPVLLLEIGYVTNPGDAQRLNNSKILGSYADSIAKAIGAFFSDKLDL